MSATSSVQYRTSEIESHILFSGPLYWVVDNPFVLPFPLPHRYLAGMELLDGDLDPVELGLDEAVNRG